MLKPIVKWAGGKRQLIPQIIKRLPKKWKTYYEPFVGGGALLIELYNKKRISTAIISDLNTELINLYKVIKNKPLELIEALKNEEFKNNKESFIKIRARFNNIIGNPKLEVERASLFIYLNRHCYNGLWRVNKEGKFNVPFGKYKKPSLPSQQLILEFSEMLKKVKILHSDFEKAVANAKTGDFVYFDPPYQPVSETAYFTSYTANGFNYNEQKRLARVFRELTNKGVLIMITNSNTDEIKALYSDYNIFIVKVNRAINSNAEKRKGASEVIITNYKTTLTEPEITLDQFRT